MKMFNFAINTRREYYDVVAKTEEEARKLLEESLDGDNPRLYYGGSNTDMQDIELIDVEGD